VWSPFVVSMGLSIVALALAAHLLPRPAAQPYSQLYLAGSWSRVRGPVRIPDGRSLSVRVGVANRTGRPQMYRLVPTLTGAPAPWRERVVRVGPGRDWTGTIGGPMPRATCLVRLEISLRRASSRQTLATVTVWLGRPSDLPCAT